jgi:general secretion pathway protein G
MPKVTPEVAEVVMKFRTHSSRNVRRREGGFTFLELLIVMTIMAILAAVAIPTYLTNIKHARETRLQSDLWVMRQAIDKYTVDKEKAPQSLQDLVTSGYLRAVPEDAISKSAETWQTVMEEETLSADTPAGIKDVKSGAEGADSSGKPYSEY